MPFFSGEKMTGGYGGADIISSCTISVNRGEIVAILGPNGAGKSTAMKAMLGLLNLKSGKISINGKLSQSEFILDLIKSRGFSDWHFENLFKILNGEIKGRVIVDVNL